MKFRLSHKDFLLVIGVVVAMIIALTTLLYKEADQKESSQKSAPAKTSLNSAPSSTSVAFKKLLKSVI